MYDILYMRHQPNRINLFMKIMYLSYLSVLAVNAQRVSDAIDTLPE
jgi:hypothetical protein